MPIMLPAAERASYMELNQQLLSQDMKLSRGGGSRIDDDRANRLRELMGTSKTPEEALLKRASHFTLDDLSENRQNAPQDCDLIVHARMAQYETTIAELKLHLKHATWLKHECKGEHEHFTKWTRSVFANAFGDAETREVLEEIMKTAEKEHSKTHEVLFYRQSPVDEIQTKEAKQKKGGKAPRIPKASSKKGSKKKCPETPIVTNVDPQENLPVRLKSDNERVQALRTLTGHLRHLAKDLVSRTRALRFFKVVRASQLWQSELLAGLAPEPLTCSKCKSTAQDPSAFSILGVCGHTACKSCLTAPERGDDCVISNCDAPAYSYHIHKAIELGQEDPKDRVGRHDGQKMDDVINLIKKIPEEDQVLVFVQFNDLMEKFSAALDHHKIKHWALTEDSRRNAHKLMDDFQTNQGEDKKKVLVLNLADESAAGA